ncbi:MAG: pantetheine-phosphate adenylyltransferase [Planctomycetes bacterium]|nr:pantetheine-phosphate adenylyltransferase [Planctomycetota bacterium]
MRRGVYPGSFDPITYGHLDLVERGAELFDELLVAVAVNPEKTPLFSPEERRDMVEEATRHLDNVTVECFRGLTVDFARARGAHYILRGIRTFADFEVEFRVALANRTVGDRAETVFILPRLEFSYISSRLVKEIASFGGDASRFVPPPVARRLEEKFAPPGSGGNRP